MGRSVSAQCGRKVNKSVSLRSPYKGIKVPIKNVLLDWRGTLYQLYHGAEKLDELKHPPDLAHARIYDRILERCAPILFAGKNFREDNAASTKAAARCIVSADHSKI